MSIDIKNLTHVYMQGTPFESTAIKNINWTVESGEFGVS